MSNLHVVLEQVRDEPIGSFCLALLARTDDLSNIERIAQHALSGGEASKGLAHMYFSDLPEATRLEFQRRADLAIRRQVPRPELVAILFRARSEAGD